MMGLLPTTKQQAKAEPQQEGPHRGYVQEKSAVVISGVLRKGKRTKELIKRLKPGEVALIDHVDLDAMAAQGLLGCKPVAVINLSAPISGRYPNRGPSILSAAKVPLYVLNDASLFDQISDGDLISILPNGSIKSKGEIYPSALEIWSAARIESAIADARLNLTSEIQKFADNTLSFVKSESVSLLEPTSVPELVGVPEIEKKHVVIVVRGEGYREDLKSIREYLSDVQPVVIGVDGGADALLEEGIKPHIIIGDMDSVSDKALKCGAKLVVHAYAISGDAPGVERIDDLDLKYETFRVPGTSEDAAMLLAYEKGAELIVVVGTHSNLEDFLDKGRAGMASTFLTRLKVGSRLVDARGVSRLHAPRLGTGAFAAVILSAVFPLAAALSYSPALRAFRSLIALWWRITMVNLQHFIRHLSIH